MERSYGDLQDKNRIISDQKVTQYLDLKVSDMFAFLNLAEKVFHIHGSSLAQGRGVSVPKIE